MAKYAALDDIPRDHKDRETLQRLIAEIERIDTAPIDHTKPIGEQLRERTERICDLLEQVKAMVPTVSIGVADGRALYAVRSYDDSWMVFQWLDGGPDHYVSPFGHIIAVPRETGGRMIHRERKLAQLFGGD